MEDGKPEQRRAATRASLFLTAVIEAATGKANVRIRNLSETGALLEGPAFPSVGTKVRLRRQEMEIDADIVWVQSNQCGVRFHGQIAISEWIAGRTGAWGGQARVDAIQEAARSGGAVPDCLSQEEAPVPHAKQTVDERIAQEIAFVQRLLDHASDELIGDPAVVNRHPQALQAFDIADQILGHLARVIQATDREAAIMAIGMEELRARLLRKPLT